MDIAVDIGDRLVGLALRPVPRVRLALQYSLGAAVRCGHWSSFGMVLRPVPRVRFALRLGPVRCRPPLCLLTYSTGRLVNDCLSLHLVIPVAGSEHKAAVR